MVYHAVAEQRIVVPRVGSRQSATGGERIGRSVRPDPIQRCTKPRPRSWPRGEDIPRIAKQMASFQYKTIIFKGQFSIISAFSIEKFGESWHYVMQSAVPWVERRELHVGVRRRCELVDSSVRAVVIPTPDHSSIESEQTNPCISGSAQVS